MNISTLFKHPVWLWHLKIFSDLTAKVAGAFLLILVFGCGFQIHAGTEMKKESAVSLTAASTAAYGITPAGYLFGTTSEPLGSSISLGVQTGKYIDVNKGGSTGAVSWSVVNGSGSASITGNTLSLTGAGTVLVRAFVAGDATYDAATYFLTVQVNQVMPVISFASANSGVYGNTSFALSVDKGGSTGAVSYVVTNGTGSAILTGSTLNLTKVGTITINAYVAGDANYFSNSINQTFTITKATPVISFTSPNNGVYGNTAFPLSINRGASTGAVTYSVANITGNATVVSGDRLDLTGAGTILVTATIAADANYNSTFVDQNFTITKATPVGILSGTSVITYGEIMSLGNTSSPNNLLINPGGSTGAVTWSVANGTGSATLSGNILSSTGAGTVTVTATVAADANYNARSYNRTITITKISPVISFTSANTGIYGNHSFNLSVNNGGSTGAVTYTVTNGTGSATLSGSTLDLTGAGSVNITATIAGDANYYSSNVNQTFIVTKATPVISFISASTGTMASTIPLNINAGGSNGLVTYSVVNGSGSATIVSGTFLNLTGVGTVTVTATVAADANYNSATTTQTVTIGKADPSGFINGTSFIQYGNTITLGGASGNYLNVDTGGSTGAVTYAVTNGTGSATISGNTLSPTGTGTVTVTVTVAADANYNAKSYTRVITIGIGNPVLSFTSANTGVYGDNSFALSVDKGGSTGAVTYSITNGSGSATLNGSTLNLTGAGTIQITASVAGDANYSSGNAFQTFTITKVTPVISFASGNIGVYGDISFPLSINSGGSGGAITYSVTNGTGSATVSGSTLNLTGAGTVTITATIANTTNYNSTSVNQAFTIMKATPVISFTSANTGVYGNNSFALAVDKGGSTGAVTYTTTTVTGSATVSGSTLNLTGAGIINVLATIAADANYNSTAVNQSFTITKATPAISFTSANTGVYGNSSFALSINKGGSTGAVTYSVINGTGNATVSGSTLNLIGVGTVTVTATIAADANYNSTSVNQAFTITKFIPVISFTSANTGVYGNNSFTLSVDKGGSTGAVIYAVTNVTGSATVSGSTLSLTGAGTVTITATVASDANYNSGSVAQTFTITKATPVISFTSANTGIYGNSSFGLVIDKGGSTGAVTYTVNPVSGSATVSGSTLNLTGAGIVNVLATIAADANYNSTAVNQSFTIAKATPVINFTSPSKGVYGNSSFPLTINTGGSTGAVTYSVTNGTGSAILNGSTLELTGVGTVTLIVTMAADANYTSSSATQTFTITKATPEITFTSANTGVYGNNSFALSADKGGSTGAVAYSVTNGTGSATLSSGNILNLTGAGTVTLTATVAADAIYNSASVDQTFTITKATPVISFTSSNTGVYGNSSFVLSMDNGGSTGDVTYAVTNGSGSATLTGSTLKLTGAGTVMVTATIAEDANYNSTSEDSLLTITKADQTISFGPLTDKSVNAEAFDISASSDSGLPVTFTIQSGPAILSGDNKTITLTGTTGTVRVIASQPGDNNYNVATDVEQDFEVNNKFTATLSFENFSTTYGATAFTPQASTNSSTAIVFTLLPGGTGTAELINNLIKPTASGTVNIRATINSDANYNGVVKDAVMTINKADQTITFDAIADKVYGETFDLVASSTSQLDITFTSSNPEIVEINGQQATIIGTGMATIVAHQAGNANYNEAPEVTQTFKVVKDQTITFDAITDKNYGETFDLVASSTSQLDVTFTSSSPEIVEINGHQATIIGRGTATIVAHQAGDDNYNEAPNVSQSFEAKASSPALSVSALAYDDLLTGESAVKKVTITNKGNADLTIGKIIYPVTYQGDKASGKVTPGSSMEVAVTFNPTQPGEYSGEITFEVTKSKEAPNGLLKLPVSGKGITITAVDVPLDRIAKVYPNPVTDFIEIHSSQLKEGMSAAIYDANGHVVLSTQLNGISNNVYRIEVSELNRGVYFLKIKLEDGVTTKRIIKN